jgi:cell division protein FtsB
MSYLSLVAVLLLPPLFVHAEAQQAGINPRGIVESAEISGIDEDEISLGTRDSVLKLVGQPFDQKAADDLVMRIHEEKPEFTTSVRLLAGDQSDRVKVVFLLEKTNVEGESNVNSRYMVEKVEINGFDESKLSQSIRDEIAKLVGEKLDEDKAEQIQHRIEDELRPKNTVGRRVVKGSDRQHIVLVYDVRKVRWIPFVAQEPGHVIYHSKEHWSSAASGNIFDNKSARLYFGLANTQDPLIERFAGLNVGFEAIEVGTDRLGLALRYSRYREQWDPSTVAADQNAIYRHRNTFDPTITFAFDPHLRLTTGVSVSDLEIQYPAIHHDNANAAVASLTFQNAWGKSAELKHALEANYVLRAGNHNLDSDFIYTRHFAQVRYVYGSTRPLLVGFMAGTISGNAPLFERFSLGDTTTLRGWNKFDVAPAGGNRMVHATLEYGFNNSGKAQLHINQSPIRDFKLGFNVFYDAGAVGNQGSPIKARHSAGFGFGSSNFSSFFAEIAFPIRGSNVGPVFMMGFRF